MNLSPTVHVDPEFKKLIPPLSAEELTGLEAAIIRDGRATVPLVIWGDSILLDGHNRFALCQKHGLPYSVRKVSGVEDRDGAELWIIDNQLSRRNLPVIDQVQLRDRQAKILGEKAKANMHAGRPPKAEEASANSREVRPPCKVNAELAKSIGVGERTVDHARTVLKKGTPELRAAVRSGDIAISTAAKIATLPAAKQREVAAAGPKAATVAAKAIKAEKHAEKEQKVKARLVEQAKAAPVRAEIRKSDALKFIASLDDHSVDLLLTDPPYSTDVEDIARFAWWLRDTLTKVKNTGRAYICVGAYSLELLTYLEVLRAMKWLDRSQILVWTYRNTLGPSPSHDYKQNWQAILYVRGSKAEPLDCPKMTEQFSVQDINAPDGRLGNRYHAWQKPDELADRFIRHASKPGDLVVDPFAGTGTFLLSAARLGRKAIGCDNDDERIAIAVKRGCVHA